MPKFKPYNQSQAMLLPPRLADCLPVDHIAFLIDETVNNLDLSPLEATYSDSGCPAYDPGLMIKMLFYGHTQGVTSSRKLERAAYENNAFRFLAGNCQPDHGTISLFRKRHLTGLKEVFSQIVVLCGKLDMADLSDISVDGSKFKASASKKNLFSSERIESLNEKIEKALREAVAEDEAEDRRFGDQVGYNQIPAGLRDPAKRKKEIARARRRLQQLREADKRIRDKQGKVKTKEEGKLKKNSTSNTTDPDANLMKMKNNAYEMAQNAQLAAAGQVITGYDITDSACDQGQLKPMIEESERMTGRKVERVKADCGYFNKEDLKFCLGRGTDAYVPDQEKASEERQERTGKVPVFDRRNFCYRKDIDSFICPRGKPLAFVGIDRYKGRKYQGLECQSCPKRKECTKGERRCLFHDQEMETIRRDMRKKLNTVQGKAKYLERLSEIEPVFGHFRTVQNFTGFLARGKPMALIELGLHASAHNLVKIFNFLKKNKTTLEEAQLNTIMRLQAG